LSTCRIVRGQTTTTGFCSRGAQRCGYERKDHYIYYGRHSLAIAKVKFDWYLEMFRTEIIS